MNTENTFQWNDALVTEFVQSITTEQNKEFVLAYTFDKIKQFKASHNPMPERIEVSHLAYHDTIKGNQTDSYFYQFRTSRPLWESQFPGIKEAIEKAVNPETDLQKEKDAIPLGELQPKEKDTLSRDWEIVRYGYCQNNEGNPEERYIESVRRLSDNTVWTVGEKINYGYIQGMKVGVNDRGKKDMSQIYVSITSDKNLSNLCAGMPLSDLKKLTPNQQPLFVTEDGVSKFKGDSCFWVELANWYVSRWYSIPEDLNSLGWEFDSCKYFSTKEAADEYVRQNKPHFSLDEIIKIVRSLNDGTKGHDAKSFLVFEFNQLANSKNRNH